MGTVHRVEGGQLPRQREGEPLGRPFGTPEASPPKNGCGSWSHRMDWLNDPRPRARST